MHVSQNLNIAQAAETQGTWAAQNKLITLWKIVCKVCLDKTLPAYPSCPSSLVRQECPGNEKEKKREVGSSGETEEW